MSAFTIPAEIRRAHEKVFRLTVNGQQVFVKQRRANKNPMGKWAQRLLHALTGNPLLTPTGVSDNNVRTEVANLRALAALGIPVPEVLHEEDDYFVMTRTGRKLERYLVVEPKKREAYIRQAVELLGRLHGLDLAHGGAQIRNFTKPEDNDRISLIDFEEVIPTDRLADFQLRDLFLLVFSLEKMNMAPDIRTICGYYRRDWQDTHYRLCRAAMGLSAAALADRLMPARFRMTDVRALARLAARASCELQQG